MARPLAPRIGGCPDPSRVGPARGATSWCDKCEKAVHNLSNLGDDDARRVLTDPTACVRFNRTRAGRVARAVSVAVAIAASTSAAAASRIEVLVVDPEGVPVPGAQVVATLHGREIKVYADDAGVATFSSHTEGGYAVVASVGEVMETGKPPWSGEREGPLWPGVERVVVRLDRNPDYGMTAVGEFSDAPRITDEERVRWRARPIDWFKERNARLVRTPPGWRPLLPSARGEFPQPAAPEEERHGQRVYPAQRISGL
jgi:hypothetical protein